MNKKSILWGAILMIGIVLGIAFESEATPKQQPKTVEQKEQPKIGGTLIFALGKEFANPNPFINTSSTFQFVKETSYESLLALDNEDSIIPNLAQSYEVSSGGTVFTLHLRKGVKFHNGKEMKADDVLWSANHVKDPKNGAFGQSIMKDVKSIERGDDYTVKFTLESPSVMFLSHLATIRMLPIVPASSLQTGQTKLEANTFVPGTGPFVFEQYQPGFDTVLKKFPEYWGSPAYLDKLIFRPITDVANRFNALRSGDAHMADRLSVLDASRVKKGEVKGIQIVEEPLGGFQHLIFNWLNPLFQKLEMRQAILYAIDKKRLAEETYYGAATPTELMLDPKGRWSKAANLPPQKRDLAKAKALLKAAGYKGQELVYIGRKTDAQFMESLQRELGEAGIKVKVEILESGVYKERYGAGKYDLYVAGGTITDDPVTTMFDGYHSTQVVKGHYGNPKVDQLFESLSTEFNQKKRLNLFKEMAWTLHNDVADVPMLFETRFTGMSEKVQGFWPPKGSDYIESGLYFKRTWLK